MAAQAPAYVFVSFESLNISFGSFAISYFSQVITILHYSILKCYHFLLPLWFPEKLLFFPYLFFHPFPNCCWHQYQKAEPVLWLFLRSLYECLLLEKMAFLSFESSSSQRFLQYHLKQIRKMHPVKADYILFYQFSPHLSHP